jgi:hypothetical protein
VAKQSFEFRNTKNGTRVVTKGIVDYQTVKAFFETKNLSYYTFYPKVEKSIKAVISHLPINAHAEGIADGLVDLGFGGSCGFSMTELQSTMKRMPWQWLNETCPGR